MEAMDHAPLAEGTAHHHGMGLRECNGTQNYSQKGTPKGHILPGTAFILWGSWWALNICATYLWRSSRRPYAARAWFPFPLRALRYLEPALKLLLPPLAVSVELYFDHDSFLSMYCPPGTELAGRFVETHASNWQHTATYPMFMLAGLMDVLSNWVPLPPQASQGMLGLAFSTMAFLMGTHKKHEALDAMSHWLLFVCMLVATVLIFLEMHARENPMVGLAKAAAVIFQGAWLVQVAAVEFAGLPQWSTDYMGGLMLAPVVFVFMAVLVVACLLALYTALALIRGRSTAYAPLPAFEQASGKGNEMFDSDSAQMDESPRASPGSPAILPFHIAHARHDSDLHV